MWMEAEGKVRVNFLRMDEVIAVNPGLVATACPFCLTMLDDARKVRGVEERIQVKDVAEIVAEALG
jgi:Fe-S oxidoreductase